MERQSLNVFRMRLLGAEVRPVNSGTCTLKDATSEAIRDWVTNVESTHYILGSTAGPHPYPMMVRCLPCLAIKLLECLLALGRYVHPQGCDGRGHLLLAPMCSPHYTPRLHCRAAAHPLVVCCPSLHAHQTLAKHACY